MHFTMDVPISNDAVRTDGWFELAAKVEGLNDWAEEKGYLLAFNRNTGLFLISWDDTDREWVTSDDFQVIG